jgi:hypothetical protein
MNTVTEPRRIVSSQEFYAGLSSDDFRDQVENLAQDAGWYWIFQLPGVYEIVSEALNNQALEACKDNQDILTNEMADVLILDDEDSVTLVAEVPEETGGELIEAEIDTDWATVKLLVDKGYFTVEPEEKGDALVASNMKDGITLPILEKMIEGAPNGIFLIL